MLSAPVSHQLMQFYGGQDAAHTVVKLLLGAKPLRLRWPAYLASGGMTIGACAWMEKVWMQSLTQEERDNFEAKRYMDDVIIFYTDKFDAGKIKECYNAPLKLEDAASDTFLESTFHVTTHNNIQYWLKNDNHPNVPPKTWRYAHFHSHMAYNQKKAVLKACLQKVHKMASDNTARRISAIHKLVEFGKLGYPYKLLWSMCTTMGVESREIQCGLKYVIL